MTTFFSSDQHYWHNNIIKYCERPFSSTEEMVDTLITNHNSVVKNNDTVYYCGDITMNSKNHSMINRLLSKLNGKKHLILGNHDASLDKISNSIKGFESISHYKEISINGKFIVLFHYAQRVWNRSHHGSYHLYGHSHGTLPETDSLSFDVGVDCWNYFPVSIESVIKKMEYKKENPGKIPEEVAGLGNNEIMKKISEINAQFV